MKLSRACFIFFAIITAATFSYSQTQTFTGAKIAVVNTVVFGDEKEGITRLVNAYKSLETEFKPKQDELIALSAQLDKIAKDIQALQNKLNNASTSVPVDKNAVQTEIENKNDEGSRLQLTIKRKQEDAKAQYEKRKTIVVGPIKTDIGKALDAFARSRGIDMIFDGIKLEESGILLSVNKTVDLTDIFIRDYNAKNAGVPVRK